jgi:hypothetical protein
MATVDASTATTLKHARAAFERWTVADETDLIVAEVTRGMLYRYDERAPRGMKWLSREANQFTTTSVGDVS